MKTEHPRGSIGEGDISRDDVFKNRYDDAGKAFGDGYTTLRGSKVFDSANDRHDAESH